MSLFERYSRKKEKRNLQVMARLARRNAKKKNSNLQTSVGYPGPVAAGTGTIKHTGLADMPSATNADHDDRYRRICSKVIVIDGTGCGDYTTIQAAITANATTGVVFLVNPGTYTDDTIAFTANSQTVMGTGVSPATCKITTASSNIVDYGAFTGCRINRMKMEVTAGTTLVHTAQGSTGSCNFVKCHTSMTTSYATAGTQPSTFYASGASTIKVVEGTAEYNHTGSNAAIAKALLNSGANAATTTFELCNINLTCSGSSFVSGLSFGTGATVVNMDRCNYDIEDNGTAIVVGLYVAGAGSGEFAYNDVHVAGTGVLAIGMFINAAGADIRTMYNHIHVENATTNNSFLIGAFASTITSQFDDIIAANGANINALGTFTYVNSQDDGELTASVSATINDYTLPLADGTAGQVIETDGSGVLTFEDSGGASYWDRTGTVLSPATAGDTVEMNAEIHFDLAAPGVTTALRISGAADDLLQLKSSSINFGDGTNPVDTQIARTAVNTLTLTDTTSSAAASDLNLLHLYAAGYVDVAESSDTPLAGPPAAGNVRLIPGEDGRFYAIDSDANRHDLTQRTPHYFAGWTAAQNATKGFTWDSDAYNSGLGIEAAVIAAQMANFDFTNQAALASYGVWEWTADCVIAIEEPLTYLYNQSQVAVWTPFGRQGDNNDNCRCYVQARIKVSAVADFENIYLVLNDATTADAYATKALSANLIGSMSDDTWYIATLVVAGTDVGGWNECLRAGVLAQGKLYEAETEATKVDFYLDWIKGWMFAN